MRRYPLAIAEFIARPTAERRIGPFVLLDQLGQGGFAPVWAARETYDGTEVRDAAVKLFSLGRQTSLTKDRVVREAQALCRVDHPHVVRFYSLAIDEAAGIGALAMELVAGRSLGARIRESGPIAAEEVLRIGTALANALAEVHRAGLLHRDVKPDNVVESAGTYKLIDFGIALPSAEEIESDMPDEPGQTERLAHGPTGTTGFVAPEYLRDEPPHVAGELYALGATLHMCLVGCPPAARTNVFPWDLDPDVLEGKRPAPQVNLRAPQAPAGLVEIIERLIAPNPDNRPPSASWVEERLQAMLRGSSQQTRSLPSEELGPFRGLGRFEAEDRDVFFGRDGEIASVLELLRKRRLVVLVGPSGSGKSSLARAGILPRVADGALEQWPKHWDTTIVVPGADPRAALLKSISTWIGHDLSPDVDEIVEALEDHVQDNGRGLLLFIDPLEELVTLQQEAPANSREFFITLLARLADRAPEGIKILAAARRDLLDSLLALPLGKTLAQSFVLVEPLPTFKLREVLQRALDVYGYALEEESLADELLAGFEHSVNAMPLVAFALTEAWRLRDKQGKRLTRAGIASIGGVRGALKKHAETTLVKFTGGDTEKLRLVRRMFLGLTTLDGTRASKSLDKLRLIGGPSADEFVEAFVAARLCVPVEGGITLAHEALTTQWPRLASWIEKARGPRQTVAELERAAQFWKTDPDVAPLLRGEKLERIQHEVHAAEGEWLSDDAWAYLTTSLGAARKRRQWFALSLVGLSIMIFGAGIGWMKRNAPVPIAQPVERILPESGRQTTTIEQSAEAPTNRPVLRTNASSSEPIVSAKPWRATKRIALPPSAIAPTNSVSAPVVTETPKAPMDTNDTKRVIETPSSTIPTPPAPLPTRKTKAPLHRL